MAIDNVQPEQQPNSEPKPIDTTSSPDIGNTPVVGSPLSEMSRFINSEELVKHKVYQILSALKDVDVLQAKEAVGIVSSYLFRVGQKSQEGLMLYN